MIQRSSVIFKRFEAQTPDEYKFEVYPRLYPFCLTHAQLIDPDRTRTDSHAYRFHEIFEDIERINAPYYNFNVTTDSVLGEVGKEWIEDVIKNAYFSLLYFLRLFK